MEPDTLAALATAASAVVAIGAIGALTVSLHAARSNRRSAMADTKSAALNEAANKLTEDHWRWISSATTKNEKRPMNDSARLTLARSAPP